MSSEELTGVSWCQLTFAEKQVLRELLVFVTKLHFWTKYQKLLKIRSATLKKKCVQVTCASNTISSMCTISL